MTTTETTAGAAPARPSTHTPSRAEQLAELRAGLSRPQKELASRYFYDERGSELFEEITRLPEYYPTRAEREILERQMPAWASRLGSRTVVELGAGSAAKSRVILDSLRAAGTLHTYVPVDVSADFLEASARKVRAEYPGLRVQPAPGDFTHRIHLPDALPSPSLLVFLGGTIGNFAAPHDAELLTRFASLMRPGDHLLLGTDLRKDPAVLEAAYDDAQGVTAEFNLNALHVVNRLFGADFDVRDFHHRAFYDRELHRIEMHLVAGRDVRVRVPGAGDFRIARGESIRTEVSCKYDRASVRALLAAAGLRLSDWKTDSGDRFALSLSVLRDDDAGAAAVRAD